MLSLYFCLSLNSSSINVFRSSSGASFHSFANTLESSVLLSSLFNCLTSVRLELENDKNADGGRFGADTEMP